MTPVIVRLFGGLGNQMFQYAAGRALSLRLNVPLKLDTSVCRKDRLRDYALGGFNIQETIAAEEEIQTFKPPRSLSARSIAARLRGKCLPWHRQRVIRERTFAFDPDFMKIRRGCYLEGFWQSETYFSGYEKILRNEFTLKMGPGDEIRRLLTQIEESNSVSLHIRRGDYVSNPDARRVHGVLGLDYYRDAMDLIASRTDRPQFFIFSDDTPWARENLDSDFPVVFAGDGHSAGDHEDLRLMSHCRHHIIANSSFSWWGAWLSGNEKKIVIAPKAWFSEETMREKSTNDLIPERWMTI